MGAETVVYVKVLKNYVCWEQVSAVTLGEAIEIAKGLPNVAYVLGASYEPEKE